jgi:hypothetical protein
MISPNTDPNVEISNARDAARIQMRCLIDPHDPYIDRSVFKRAIAKFGINNQVLMIIEECSELILAISHYNRGRVRCNAVMEEVVDLTIMLEQARLIYDPTDVEFNRIYIEKINRLEKLIKET